MELSISGVRFVSDHAILQHLPESRLATLSKEDPQFDPADNAYFFERNPLFFPHILQAYKPGATRFHISHDLCAQAMFDELEFWQIPLELLSPCCSVRHQ